MSSPGAERVLQLPQDLARFGELPLRVEYTDAAGAQMSQVRGAAGPGAPDVHGGVAEARPRSKEAKQLVSAGWPRAATALLQALLLQSYDEASGATVWRLAEVRANAAVKGRAMSKKQKELRLEIPLAAVARIRVFVDF